jgi:hypothetical protein
MKNFSEGQLVVGVTGRAASLASSASAGGDRLGVLWQCGPRVKRGCLRDTGSTDASDDLDSLCSFIKLPVADAEQCHTALESLQ